jgi:hypothetical protein
MSGLKNMRHTSIIKKYVNANPVANNGLAHKKYVMPGRFPQNKKSPMTNTFFVQFSSKTPRAKHEGNSWSTSCVLETPWESGQFVKMHDAPFGICPPTKNAHTHIHMLQTVFETTICNPYRRTFNNTVKHEKC